MNASDEHLRHEGAFERSGWDVITGVRIQVIQGAQRHRGDPKHYEWSASLWYARLKDMPDYRWYEVSYFSLSNVSEYAPFALDFPEADGAAGPGIHKYQIAFGPVPIDDEDTEQFCDRWADLLARAAQYQLSYPRNLPLR